MQLPGRTKFYASRQYDVDCATVFRAFTDPDEFRAWFNPTGLLMNAIEGGLFWFEVDLGGGVGVSHYGRYIVVDEPHRLEFTWMSVGTSGWETFVEIDILPVDGGGAEVRITHSEVPDDEMGRGHQVGWQNVLMALETAFPAETQTAS